METRGRHAHREASAQMACAPRACVACRTMSRRLLAGRDVLVISNARSLGGCYFNTRIERMFRSFGRLLSATCFAAGLASQAAGQAPTAAAGQDSTPKAGQDAKPQGAAPTTKAENGVSVELYGFAMADAIYEFKQSRPE